MNSNSLARLVSAALMIACLPGFPRVDSKTEFISRWPAEVERPWAGPDYWTNPLQDWRVRQGRLECIVPGGDRNVFLLTREASPRSGTLDMSVLLGRLEEDSQPLGEGFVGFRLGIRGFFRDYRDSAVRGEGLNAGMAWDGRLFIGALDPAQPKVPAPFQSIQLSLQVRPAGREYRLELEARSVQGRSLSRIVRDDIAPEWLTGGLALVCSSGPVEPTPPAKIQLIDPGFGSKKGTQRGGTLRFWFRDWRVSGSKIDVHEERAFGPILFTLHTLSRNVLKLTAQMAPIEDPQRDLELHVRREAAAPWTAVARAPMDLLSRTATFRIPNWNDRRDVPYRVILRMKEGAGRENGYGYEGTIRRDPAAKRRIVAAAFTGNNDFGFPHADVSKNVATFGPDILLFTGDNIYERVGEYGTQRAPLETATLDYLRKWMLFGWEYRELLKDIPAVTIPDDHDVFHGNLWGAGGRHAEGTGNEGQDRGGYTMPAAWVNMVQRTQTAHLPDPYDPTPVEQGISVYYTQLLYGGVSFAILEDRKWKSAPRDFLAKARIVNGWPQNPAYDAAREGDAPGAELLGPRQLEFLESWAKDWSGGAWMKVVVSQTIFANVATLPKGSNTDAGIPQLEVLKPGEYPDNDVPVMDHDSNGWPQAARNMALRAMRRAFALHIAGDQHLGSTIQYGIEDWNDASYALCVPSVSNVFPRRWFPSEPGRNRKPGSPRETGEFLDGFGNRMTVHAVSNPAIVGAEPASLHRRAPGYGIVTFDRATRKITMVNWPRWVDVSRPGARPYPGWPVVIDQIDNGMPRSGLFLERLVVNDIREPVVQVSDQTTGEILYTLRISGTAFTPAVPREGIYTVRVLDPDRGIDRVYRDRRAVARPQR